MLKKIFLLLIVSIVIILISGGLWLNKYLEQPGPLADEAVVIIAPGSSISIISKMLKQNSVITDEQIFALTARGFAYNAPLKSGEYSFAKNISLHDVIKLLQSGKSLARKITIPEGLSVKQILDIINNEKFLKGEAIAEDIAEGSLLPSTYYFSYGNKKREIIGKMQEAGSRHMSDMLTKYDIKPPLYSKHDVLTLASIVEKEASNDLERPLIAGVFINRLNAGMKLQADPTILYAITNGRYNLGRLLNKQDLQYESPYNSYLFKGLPPGPICCPGEKSIEAVLNPSPTDAYYFVVNAEGGHSFARNLNQHLKNVKIYRKIQKKKRREAASIKNNKNDS